MPPPRRRCHPAAGCGPSALLRGRRPPSALRGVQILFKTLTIFSTPRQASSTRPRGCPGGCAQWPVAQACGVPAWHSQRSRHGRACRPRCGRTHPGHGVSDGSSGRSIRLLLLRVRRITALSPRGLAGVSSIKSWAAVVCCVQVGGRRGRWRRGRLMRTEGRRRGSPRQAFEVGAGDPS
jgi:hypothetical protein